MEWQWNCRRQQLHLNTLKSIFWFKCKLWNYFSILSFWKRGRDIIPGVVLLCCLLCIASCLSVKVVGKWSSFHLLPPFSLWKLCYRYCQTWQQEWPVVECSLLLASFKYCTSVHLWDTYTLLEYCHSTLYFIILFSTIYLTAIVTFPIRFYI